MDPSGENQMDLEILKKRIKVLREEQASIDAEITAARQKVQTVVNEHNNRVNFLTGERNMLAGKIDILEEFVKLEKAGVPKKGK